MVYAIISDVHANAIALSAILEDARRCGAKKLLCLGDVVGYGPEPESTVSTIRARAAFTLAGNHDDAVSGRLDASDFIDLAADAVSRHREALSEENLAWLKSLPYTYTGKSFLCAHGDFTSPKTFEYISDEHEAAANFAATKAQLMFVGHSHVPGIFLTGASGKVYSLPPTDFTLEDGKRYIVNPGSVGYPRTNGNVCESTYVLYDDTEKTVSFRRLPFTVRSVMQTGRNPKRLKKRIVAAAACAAAVAAGAAAWMLAPEERVETVTEVLTNNVTRVVEKVVAIRQIDRAENCTLFSTDKKVRVEVKLAKGSPAAQLQLTFKDESGKILWEERWTAKKSKKATVSVPKGAASATLSAGRASGDTSATFDIFKLYPKQ
ncbi:MAG: metallophosphoesterase family protein [Kiritimatiellae bacterium]|nr:metallophosphoesterase family protein [Kiritimatiellia bacterium]